MEDNFGPDFITVTDEDGNDFELELVDTLEYKGITYYAMFPRRGGGRVHRRAPGCGRRR